ncbi:MAG: UDP-N-acetylglucosamine 1-carboxyvinyltransferase [Elusimicrobiota bacterium]
MDAFEIEGGHPLRGEVEINGSKNASLPCQFASLLTAGPVRLRRVPDLRDTRTAAQLLESLGKSCARDSQGLLIKEGNLSSGAQRDAVAPYELVKQMRASVLAAGPMLSRWGKARVALPGGCAIGPRPIDIHLEGFKALGARIEVEGGDAVLRAPAKGLRAAKFRLKFPSVGATENLMLAASMIPGMTVIGNAAREPEICDLAALLRAMGAGISGDGTSRVIVGGVRQLHGADYRIQPDRIETGTFIIMASMTPGSAVTLKQCEPGHHLVLFKLLRKAGIVAIVEKDSIGIRVPLKFRPRAVSIKTEVYPGFPTDLQPLWLALMARARGTSRIGETIFENRFMHVPEMSRMGAEISVKGDMSVVRGTERLAGTKVMASDIRAGAGLIAAALAAEGVTIISRIYHIDRGYENLEVRLADIGAHIRRFVEVRYRRVEAT